ncbi:MAG: hypothetical protein JNK64_31675 [Myxococcales bacterium]|nr:hypothetical protein [Myxococcales bacterium]
MPEHATPTIEAAAAAGEFAVAAGPALTAAALALREAVAAAADEAQLRELARVVGNAWVETLVDGFVRPLAAAARGPGAGQRTATMIRELAESIIGSSARRTDLARATAFVAFLDAHQRATPPTIHFAIDADFARVLGPALAADASPATLAAGLHAMVDVTLRQFLDGPLALLGVGLVTRTAVRVGRLAIASRVRREIDRAVGEPTARARLRAMLASFAGG